MSNWFFNDNSKADSEEDIVTGFFECQDCGEAVGRATADRDNGTLVWRCPKGHTSKIEIDI